MADLDRLIEVAQELADHTITECRSCRVPLSCCDDLMGCAVAAEVARTMFDTTLEPAHDDPNRPRFLGPEGCTVAPHLRPHCTMHTCAISSIGVKLGDEAWTNRYWELRNEMDDLMAMIDR